MTKENWTKGVDYPHFMTNESLQMLSEGYLLKGETPAMAIDRVSQKADEILKRMAKDRNSDVFDGVDLASNFKRIIWDNHFCMSSPMWANMGAERGIPISCYGSYVSDSIAGIGFAINEVMNMTALGGGTSGTFSPIRKKGTVVTSKGLADGAPFYMELFEEVIKRIDQGEIRKGAFSASLDIEHGDFYEFMKIREKHSTIQKITFAVEVSDEFMERMINRDNDAIERWALVLKSRSEKGLPYIFFKGNANRNKPECYADKEIKHTNLCTEIMLPNDEKESFVCCVASMNVVKFDEWGAEGSDSIHYAILFMEAVYQDFIEKISKTDLGLNGMTRALRFAERHRALGLGVLGYHFYLQSKMIPFESSEADMINGRIFATLKNKALKASQYLAEIFGEVEMTKGTGRRHTTLLANAPTTGNASISGGVSPTIEISMGNYYIVKLSKGKFERKNPYLTELLNQKGLSKERLVEIWNQIMLEGGSCINIPELTDFEKSVFATFAETNQMQIIRQASQRQVYIDQGQSVNLNIPPNALPKDVNALYIEAWKLGLKSLYYQRSSSILRAEVNTLADMGCISCEG